jgi:hypothetical protein
VFLGVILTGGLPGIGAMAGIPMFFGGLTLIILEGTSGVPVTRKESSIHASSD